MPPRLAHRKSRKGCARCKERKVKCDEIHPTCSACQRHGVVCDYGVDKPKRRGGRVENTHKSPQAEPLSLSQSPVATNNTVPGPDTPYSVQHLDVTEEHRRLVELFLLQRYLTCIAPAFPASQSFEQADLYSDHVLAHAFNHPFLLNCIFAITSLHVVMTTNQPPRPTNKRLGHFEPTIDIPDSLRHIDFSQIHRVYLNAAVQDQRKALFEVNEKNADALGLSSIMLAYIVTSSPVKETSEDDHIYSPPIQWLLMSHSLAAVLNAAAKQLPETAVVVKLMASKDPDFRDHEALLAPSHLLPFRHILDFDDPDEAPRSQELQAAQSRTLIYIGSIYKAVQDQEPKYRIARRAMSFGPLTPREFIISLGERQSRSLVIFAHYMAIVKNADGFWWYRDLPEREIAGIKSILPSNWQWALKWPLDQITQSDDET